MGLIILLIVLFAFRRRCYYGPYWNHPYYRGYSPYPNGSYGWHPYHYGYSRCYGHRPYWY